MSYYKSPISQSTGPGNGSQTPVLPVLKYRKDKLSPFNAKKHKCLSQTLESTSLAVIKEKQSRTSLERDNSGEEEVDGEEEEEEAGGNHTMENNVDEQCLQNVNSDPEIEKNSGQRNLSSAMNGIKEEAIQNSPRRSTSNKSVTINLSHETFGEKGPPDESSETPRHKVAGKSLLKHEIKESIVRSTVSAQGRLCDSDNTHNIVEVNTEGNTIERWPSREKEKRSGLHGKVDDDMRLHGLADMDDTENVVCKHTLSCEHLNGHRRRKRSQRLRSGGGGGGGNEVKTERCIICDIAEASLNADKLDVYKLITETDYPQEFYDKYSRPFMKTSHVKEKDKDKEVIPICKPVRVTKRPDKRPLSSRDPTGPTELLQVPMSSARQVEPDLEPCSPGRRSEFHLQCRPKMNDLVIRGCEAYSERRILKGLKGWLLKKDEVYKNTLLNREPKQAVYQISSLGMAFSLPDYNNALQDRKFTNQRPATPRSYISMHTPMMKFRHHNDTTLLRSSVTAPGCSSLGTAQTPLPCMTPRQKLASQPVPPRSLPPISSTLGPGLPLSRLRL